MADFRPLLKENSEIHDGSKYNGRGKTFWFLAYEGYNNGTGYSSEFYNPTALEKNGDFSQTKANLAGDPLLLYDPTTTNLTTGARQTFLSEYGTNAIPQSMLNPVAVKTAAYFPAAQWAPRFYGDPDAASSTTSSSRGRQYVGKIDEQFTNWWRASFSEIKCWTVEPGPAWFGGPAAQSAWALWRLEDLAAVNNTITINPTTVLSARYGFNRFPNQYFNIAAPNGFDPTSLGYPSSLVGQMQRPLMFPAINMTTAYSMGTATGNAYDWYSNNASATLSHVQGRHSVKTGFDYRRLVVNGLDYSDASGSYTFNGVFTQSNASSPAANTGADLADMLLGYPASGNLERTIKLQNYTNYFGAYVQDDIRLSSRLTINAGVRWEREPGFQEVQNRLYTNFDTEAVNPAANFMNPANTPPGFVPHGVIQWAGQNGAPYQVGNPEMNKIGPRLGVAYKLDNKTILRGGAGLMWGPASVLGSPYSPAGFAAYTLYIASVDGNNTSAGSLSNPFPGGPLLPVGFAAGSYTGIGQGVSVWDPQSKAVRITQYSLDLQRELPGQMSLTVAFIGSNGANLPWDMNRDVLDPTYFSLGSSALGAAVPNPFYGVGNSPVAQGVIGTPTVPQYQLLLPFPTYSGVTFGQNPLNKSTYESGVVRLEKRMGQGLTLLTNLTWERSYDYNSSPSNLGSGAGSPQNPYNLQAERSLSQFSAPLLWNTAFTYQLPFGRGKSLLGNSKALDYVVGGWQLNGTGITRSGFPQQIQQTNFNGQYGYAVQRPNATGVPAATSGSLEARLNNYINPAAFSTVAATQFGNVGRMIPLRGPGWGGWDLSLFKTVPIYERFKAQFRLEALDAFNTPLFYGPNTNVSSGGFGTITSQANTGRQMQLCVRLMW